jgi:CMP-N-acetylneuraminic acid synthetase
MSQTNHIVALIPLRAGSQSIPHKNIYPLCNKPLAYWAIQAALDCPEIDRVFVATDGVQIQECLSALIEHPKFEIIGRSPESATDNAPTEIVLLEFASQYSFQSLILIQSTSPLLQAHDLSSGILIFKNHHYTSLLSVVPQKRFLWTQDAPTGEARPLNYSPQARLRRQDQTATYVENGAFYITQREALIESGCRLSGRIGIYPMRQASYYEVDEPEDMQLVERLLDGEAA